MVKTAGRTCELQGTCLAFTKAFFDAADVKPKPKSHTPPHSRSKRHRPLRERSLRFVEIGKAARVNAVLTVLGGEAKDDHFFRGSSA